MPCIVKELDQKYSQAIAVQNMLLNVGSSSDSNDRVAQWLREYMLQKFYDSNLKSSSWNVFKSSGLGDMAANLSKEWFVKHRAEVEEYLQDVFEQQDASEKPQSQREPRIEQFKSQLKKMSADADKRIDEFANRFAEILNSVGLKDFDFDTGNKLKSLLDNHQVNLKDALASLGTVKESPISNM